MQGSRASTAVTLYLVVAVFLVLVVVGVPTYLLSQHEFDKQATSTKEDE